MISPVLLLLLSTIHASYHVEGLAESPKFSQVAVNQNIELFSSEGSWIVSIKVRPPVRTATTERVQSLLRSMKPDPDATCVERSRDLCNLIRDMGVACREVSGILFESRMPGEMARYYQPGMGGLPHRWIQYFDTEQGWIAFDPVQRDGRISSRHIPIPSQDLWPNGRIREMSWD
ncbi:MAG TPA: transglutaminase domain-containing protein [Thermoanaerobaculia bacterium]|nr:transglutaminase domain-containing protein [Thermoanaerobaculia bacterium]HUM31145.1 transglutaminase domain-containing protein [Thermoanaerobaculia bacterium]HXK69501.1 transglutaminase domain-containing protein [Thermoanaerobaculia bacterium]